jgi:2-oxoisovalerate dehydrogenase E1 component
MVQINLNWRHVAHTLLLSRRLDELEVNTLTPQGKVKYQFSAGGHELAQILIAQALTHQHDGAAVYYRSRPFMLASGISPALALAAGMALTHTPSEGRDAGVVFNLPGSNGLTVLPSSGDVGAQYTPAAGWAQAIRYRINVLKETDWDGAMAVALGGDGSVAANGFWAALNIVTTLELPYLFFIEDNSYGLSVPSEVQVPGGDIASNLESYGNIFTLQASGSHPEEAWDAIQTAVAHIRLGKGPCLLRMRVPRLSGHTFVDNQAYKSDKQLKDERSRDPLTHLKEYLERKKVISSTEWEKMETDVEENLHAALEEAETFPEPDPDQVQRYLFFDGKAPIQGGLRPDDALIPLGTSIPTPDGPRINLIDAARRTLENEMALNPRILIYGEDVGVKGGVHGATLDMQIHFGGDRVFDTSLSEDGIIGRATGLAIAGLLPVPEIQFRKYADPAHEQINDIGTLRWRTANKFAAPVIVRIPVGYSKKTGDPWHSVSGEAVYAHTLGWRIAYPSNAEDAVGLLRTALRSDDPTFFFEHRALLDGSEARRPYPGDDYCLPFGVASRLMSGNELTLITWGAMVSRCLQAAGIFEGRVTLIDLRTIIPWDKETVLESVKHTGKVLIVHEDTYTNGFAAEISAIIAEEAFTYLDAPISRLTTPDVPIPYNVKLMNAVLPSVDKIKTKLQELLDF